MPKIVPGNDVKVDMNDAPAMGEASYFSFKNVWATVKQGGEDRYLIENISGYCRPGEALILMGPSGAGKSTLLDTLASRKTIGKWGGEIRINGQECSKAEAVRKYGYVTSDDVELASLTTLETLQFAANLKLPHFTPEQRQMKISEVMEEMHLTSRAHSKVGSVMARGLSTGERKRLSIAIELLAVTNVLFLDEPTTGLDSNTGREIVTSIIEIARKKKLAIVMTIHQPSYQILQQFDRLLLLAKGKQVFFGLTDDAIEYFETAGVQIVGNPAEVYAEVLAERGVEMSNRYYGSKLYEQNMSKIDNIHNQIGSVTLYATNQRNISMFASATGTYHAASWTTQFVNLFGREIRVYARNPLMTTSRFIAAILVALFFGGAFYKEPITIAAFQAKSVSTYAVGMFPGLFGTAAIPYWIGGRKLYYLQTSAGFFHPFVWLLTSWIIEIIFLGSMMIILMLIAFPMIGYRPESLGFYIGLYFLETFGFIGYIMMIAMFSPTTEYALSGFNFMFFYNLLMGGFFVVDAHLQLSDFVRQFLQWLSVARGFYIGALRNEQYEMPLNCSDSELLVYPLENLTTNALAAAISQLNNNSIQFSPTLQNIQSSIPSTFKTAITGLQGMGGVLAYAVLAKGNIKRVQPVLGATFPTAGYSTFLTTVQTTAYSYLTTNLNTASTADFAVANGNLSAASTMTQLKANLALFGLPTKKVCPFNNGTEFLMRQAGFTTWDFYGNVSDQFYQGYLVILGLATFTLAYIALVNCKFQKR